MGKYGVSFTLSYSFYPKFKAHTRQNRENLTENLQSSVLKNQKPVFAAITAAEQRGRKNAGEKRARKGKPLVLYMKFVPGCHANQECLKTETMLWSNTG